jgi:type I restriction enzyme M protein
MLDSPTKKRIDDARQILVGKVPDPKSQVEQITIALVYKFMDDMDRESEAMGGTASFFVKSYAKYSWRRIFAPKLSGAEQLKTYAEALEKLAQNEALPELFREIFKNAYLPYRDPETLRLFLKTIGEFEYDHSERLGDAFEYLLSVLGSQGDAGQFRTPRHIIDFMVEVVDPRKDETILDPACGTAGFLISAWKHIRAANTAKRPGDRLKPADRTRLMDNVVGYDISPDMVRLSLVNLYLHGFARPKVYEYDSLTSLGHWDEHFDVIMANPPFMSPKGGIRPHRKFSVASSRSEVLFVDYIAEHLLPTGRAAVIVPEGIIFQSQGAYVQLRTMLVEDSLVAVVSLPAGVFNPYSGVKTSILFLDKALARKAGTIAFFKVENDGFGLGAQRRAIDKDDLPTVKAELGEYLARLRAGEAVEDLQPTTGLIVAKEKVAGKGEYNLSGERYREGVASNHSFPLVFLGDASLFRVESGGTPKSEVEEYWGGGIPWATLVDLPATEFISQIVTTKRTITEQGLRDSSAKMIPANSVIVSTRATIGRIAINRVPIATNQGFKNIIIEDLARALPEYVALALTKLVPTMKAWATGGTFAEISKSKFCELQIPLPPLDVQKEIVAEIEGYQKVIDGARAVVDNYRPHIPIRPEWPVARLADVCESITDGDHQPPPKASSGIPFITISNINNDHQLDFSNTFFVPKTYYENLNESRKPRGGDVLYTVTGSYGIPVLVPSNVVFCFQRHIALIRPGSQLLHKYLCTLLASPYMLQQGHAAATGVAQKTVSLNSLRNFAIPLPPIATQRAIVAEIESEQKLVAANRELIECFEKKIQATLARVWGEDTKQDLNKESETKL